MGKIDANLMAEWIVKKTSIPSNRLKDHSDLLQKVKKNDYLVLFAGKTDTREFQMFLYTAKDFMQ